MINHDCGALLISRSGYHGYVNFALRQNSSISWPCFRSHITDNSSKRDLKEIRVHRKLVKPYWRPSLLMLERIGFAGWGDWVWGWGEGEFSRTREIWLWYVGFYGVLTVLGEGFGGHCIPLEGSWIIKRVGSEEVVICSPLHVQGETLLACIFLASKIMFLVPSGNDGCPSGWCWENPLMASYREIGEWSIVRKHTELT